MRLIDADAVIDSINELARNGLSIQEAIDAQPTVCDTKKESNSSFHFLVDDFCEHCGAFTPDIDKEECQFYSGLKKTVTEIRCGHREKCQRMCQWHEARMAERGGA